MVWPYLWDYVMWYSGGKTLRKAGQVCKFWMTDEGIFLLIKILSISKAWHQRFEIGHLHFESMTSVRKLFLNERIFNHLSLIYLLPQYRLVPGLSLPWKVGHRRPPFSFLFPDADNFSIDPVSKQMLTTEPIYQISGRITSLHLDIGIDDGSTGTGYLEWMQEVF